jgi:hypothetical protein
MRKKLIKLLRQLEQESGYKNEYNELDEHFGCVYNITECLNFPDYSFIIKKYYEKYPIVKNDTTNKISRSSIMAELRRMEADEFVMIGVQKGTKYATTESTQGPDFDEGTECTSESIVLTTKGKSEWEYLKSEATKNPVATILSIIAVIISVFALAI